MLLDFTHMKKIELLLLAVLMCVCGAYGQNYHEYIEAAQKHLQQGNYEKAQVAYNVYKQLTGKSDDNFETSLKKAKDLYKIPRNIGVPVKLDISREWSTPFLCMDSYNSFRKNPQYRIGNDTLGVVSVYVNLKDGEYDQLIRINTMQPINKTSEKSLIGNICTGDIITIISENPSFQEYSTVVKDSSITNQYLSAKILKKRIPLRGKVVDKYTREGITDALVYLYYVSYRDYLIGIYSNYEKPICKTNTNNGWFGFEGCISDYSYHIKISAPEGYYDRYSNGIDIKPNESDSLIIELIPKLLKGVVSDGKHLIKDAKIKFTPLFEDNCFTDIKGEFEIKGIKGGEIIISAEGFKTLVLDITDVLEHQYDIESAQSHPIKVKLSKGNSEDKVFGRYQYYKDKIIKL